MKFGRNVLQVNTHRLTESDFRFDVIISKWRSWRHFKQKSPATCHHPSYLLFFIPASKHSFFRNLFLHRPPTPSGLL